MRKGIWGVTVGTSISEEKIREVASETGGNAEDEKVAAAVEKYLEKNPPKVTESDPTVPDWAKEETKPSYSKSEVGLGNVDNVRQYSDSNPPPYPVVSVNGKTGKVTLGAADVGARPSNWMPTAQEVGALPDTYVPPNQTAAQVGADPAGTATAAVSTHNTSTDSHGDLRLELKAINDRLTAFFDSDNQTLDELSEIVAYITSNKALIDSITTSKVSVADIINNLTTNVANKPLSAAQGVVLKDLIDAVSNSLSNYQPKGDYALRSELPTVPTKVSQLENDKGYLTEHQDISGKLDADKLPEAVNNALAQAKASGEFDGKNGDPGEDGTSVTVKSVSESTADGGSNVVTFSDGKALTVKNGKQGSPGKTPVRGVDYYTEADKTEIVAMVIESLGGNPVFGYVDENNNIVVQGNLPDGTYSVKYEMENGSTVDIGDLVLDTNVYYTVTNTLTNCVSSNSDTQAIGGKSYSATISANDGYELSSVMVTMGGTDISSTAVSGGKITISNVTGNIVITAVAEAKAAEPTNFAEYNETNTSDWSIWINQARAGSDGTYRSDTANDGYGTAVVSNYVAVQNGDVVEFSGIYVANKNSVTYNSSKGIRQTGILTAANMATDVKDVSLNQSAYSGQFTINNSSVGYVRIGGYVLPSSKGNPVIKIKRNGAYL